MNIEIVRSVSAELVSFDGSDKQICKAARVSTGKDTTEFDATRNRGLIRYLMLNKHGSPFEHGSMTFRVEAPIFVWREHMRHRIGFSYNEESGRYKKLEPRFYVPEMARTQSGKPGHYQISDDQDLTKLMVTHLRFNARDAYMRYEDMLNAGIAREVARMVLPVNLMSSAYVTCNPRSLMNFLELRMSEQAQTEIRNLAMIYAGVFEACFPETARAFFDSSFEGGAGRVAP
jgi:thymidylate synthase (FAD)